MHYKIPYQDRTLIFDIRADLHEDVIGIIGGIIDEFISDAIFSKDFMLDWLPIRLISAGKKIFIQEPSDDKLEWRNDITSSVRDYLGRRKIHSLIHVNIFAIEYNQGIAIHKSVNIDEYCILHRSEAESPKSSGWKVVSRDIWNDQDEFSNLQVSDFDTVSVFEFTKIFGREISQVLSLPPRSAIAVKKPLRKFISITENEQSIISLKI